MSALETVVAGFIPLLDCAPLIVAAEKGLAADEGLDLTLVRETSWANIRDRIIVGHFDVAHMLGPMAIASTLGIGHLKVPLIAPYAMGLGGNAITVSTDLWMQMTLHGAQVGASANRQGAALKAVVAQRERDRRRPLTMAMVYPFSVHNYLLRYWLCAAGIHPDHHVRLVVMPPPLLVDAIRAGHIDGFCVGEPWNSLAVKLAVGCVAVPTSAIWHMSPDKVLGCRLDWVDRRPEALHALLRALQRASQWCGEADNHAEIAALLSQAKYVGSPADVLLHGLSNQLAFVPSGTPRDVPNFYTSVQNAASFPWRSHALWFYSQMVRSGQIDFSPDHLPAVTSTYAPDLYRAALARTSAQMPTHDMKAEHSSAFSDERAFDPHDLPGYLRTFQLDT